MSVLTLKQQAPLFLVGSGHGATHWIAAFFYVLLPYLSKDLGISYAQAGVFVALFHISSFIANFASGAVVDLSGRRVLYQIVSLILGALALFVFGLSSIYWLLIFCQFNWFTKISFNDVDFIIKSLRWCKTIFITYTTCHFMAML